MSRDLRYGIKCQLWAVIKKHEEKTCSCELMALMGGSPGLAVMGGNLQSEGCVFESQYHILDGHFFTCICCKSCNVFLKRRK